MNSVTSDGVLGLRCIVVLGIRSRLDAVDVPGRARPACSRCSIR